MNAFLVLSTLSTAFYLAVLIALYLDGRKHRRNHAKAIRRTASNGRPRLVGAFEGGWSEIEPLTVPTKGPKAPASTAPVKPAARSAANMNPVIIPFASVPAKGN
jgi:hypothetical protein